MGEFKSTNNVLEAIQGQILDQLSGDADLVDAVFVFDGTLSQAIEDHFGQSVASHARAMVFIAQTSVLPESRAGDGSALLSGRVIDIYTVVRASGKTRYTKDRERLYDISDALWHTVFFGSDRTEDFKDHIAVFRPESITRQPSGSEVMSHLLRFTCVPRRT